MRKLPEKVLHVGYSGNDPWMLPILSAVNGAINREKIKDISSTKSLGNLSLSISRKLDFIPIIIYRLNKNTAELLSHVSKRNKKNDKYAFEVNEWLVHKILIDIDSFLFEINSCCELMRELVEKIMGYLGAIDFDFVSFVRSISEENKIDTMWFTLLNTERNYFMHNYAPYIDIDISDASKYDILIQKENLHEYLDIEKFIRLNEFDTIVQNFQKIRQLIQKKLIEILTKE